MPQPHPLPRPAVVVATIGCLAAATLLAAPTSAVAHENTRVIGGSFPSENYPFSVALPRCGATLIAPTWVVTAAHCITTDQPQPVRVGSIWREEGEARTVVHWVKHPYAGEFRNDIALGRLDAAPASTPLPLATAHPPPGTPTRILGWGFFHLVPPQVQSPHLRELDTSVVEPSRCGTDAHGQAAPFDPAVELCTDNPDSKGPCTLDSGSPQLVMVDGRWAVLGVTNRSSGGECGQQPSVYASIPGHLAWIRSVVGTA